MTNVRMRRFLLLVGFLCLTTVVNAAVIGWKDAASGLWVDWVDKNTKDAVKVIQVPNNESAYSGSYTIPANILSPEDPEVSVPVTEIAVSAFKGATDLTDVIIEATITTIGKETFKNSGLTSIVLPPTLEEIGTNAFENTQLANISIPATVTYIGGSAFNNCTKLKKATFDSIEALCGITFDGSTSNPLYYAHDLYFGDSKITQLSIPATVTSIPAYALQNCNSLTRVTIMEGVESIGISSFEGCSGLQSVSIPSSVTEINNRAFNVGSTNSLEEARFATWATLYNITFADKNSNPLYNAHHLYIGNNEQESKEVTLPSTAYIKPRIFAGASFITRVTIPSQVTFIGEDAFCDCSKINTVIYEDENQLKETSYANEKANPLYYGATPSITGVALGTLTFTHNIKDNAFTNAKWLTEITIGPGVTSIGKNAFKACTNLSTVNFQGNTLTTIDDDAFYGCSALQVISLPSSMTTIGTRAFRDSKLTSINIPAECTTLGSSIFENCTALTTATFATNATMTSLPDNIFKGCNNLISVTIPEVVAAIGDGAFQGCSKLPAPPISTALITIGKNAFNGCTGIFDLVLSEKGSLATIGESAFRGCNKITMASLPATIDIIGNNAFSGCTALTDIYIYRTTVPTTIFTETFGGRQSEMKLHVENETAKTAYEKAPIWTDFDIVTKSECTLTFYFNEQLTDPLTSKTYSISGEAGKPIKDEKLNTLNTLRDLTERDDFSGWWNNQGKIVDIPSVFPSENISYYGYYSTTYDTDKFKYLLEPAETLNNRNLERRATVVGHHLTQSDTDIKIPQTIGTPSYTVDSIAPNALSGVDIYTLELPNTIKGIGDAAFKNCSNLMSVNIPTALDSIRNNVFEGCLALTSIKIPTNVKKIGYQAFCNSGLSEITIPATIEKMSNEVFKDCKSLETVVFAESFNLSIPKYTFWNCTRLSNITLRSSIGAIGECAFQNCDSIRNINFIPEGLNVISNYAFAYCDSLNIITLPRTISNIGKKVFTGCSKIVQITVNTEEDDIAPSAAKDAFDQTVYDNAQLYVKYPAKFTAEPWSIFAHCNTAQTYTLTYKVDGETYTINNEPQTIPYMVGESLTPISEPVKAGHEFSGWQGMPAIMPGEDVNVYGKFKYKLSFSYADGSEKPENDKEFSLPKDEWYFYGDAIDKDALLKALQWAEYDYDDIEIPATMPANDLPIEIMYRRAEQTASFEYQNTSLNYKVYLLDDKAEVIASPNVAGNITIPANIVYNEKVYPVKAIQDGAFEGNQKITKMTIEADITSIGSRAFFDNRFTTFTIPTNVERIGADAFLCCSSMATLTFNDKIEELPSGVFRNCLALSDVNLPSSITRIGKQAFAGCSKLELLTINNTTMPNAEASTFDQNQYAYTKLRVPVGVDVDNLPTPWLNFVDKAVEGGVSTTNKCTTPEIVYDKGKLKFSCSTADAEIVSWVDVDDVQQRVGNEWELVRIYTIHAYARKTSWIKSDEPQNVTITWRNGTPTFGEGFKSVTLEKSYPDVNNDGKINTVDATEILKMLVE